MPTDIIELQLDDNITPPTPLPPLPLHSPQPELNNIHPEISPFKELWSIAWPTVLTMTSYTIMQFVDGLMVSVIGPMEFSAQGNGGIFAFLPLAFVMGMLSVVNTFVSQNLGAETPENGPKYAWGALWLAAAMWIMLIPYAIALPYIFSLSNHCAELIVLESNYARILIYGAILTMSSRALSHYFYGMHKPKIIFVSTVIGNLTNVGANALLIFGYLGFPKLGLAGAAYGTVIGTGVELLIPVWVFLGPKMNAQFHTRSAWKPSKPVLFDLFRIGWPKGAQFGNEMVCWSIFMVFLVGNFGEAHMAAGWIALKYMHLSFMPAVGISVAVTAVVGKYIGAGKPDIANQRAWLGVRMAMLYMGVCALIFVVFRRPLVEVFLWFKANKDNVEDIQMAQDILVIGSRLLICAAIFQLFDAVAITLSGALGGAGDTVWPGLVTIASSWIFIVGLGWFLSVYFHNLESLGPWIGAATYIIILGILFFWRWMSGHWRKIDLLRKNHSI